MAARAKAAKQFAPALGWTKPLRGSDLGARRGVIEERVREGIGIG